MIKEKIIKLLKQIDISFAVKMTNLIPIFLLKYALIHSLRFFIS